MARRALQVAAGLLLLLGLLGLSTALIAEVREEVIDRSQRQQGTPEREIQQRQTGLPVENLTLLDEAEVQAPAYQVQGLEIVFTGPAQLQISPGGEILPGPVPLPDPAQMVLPAGSQVTPTRVACPDGCTLGLETRKLSLPPNASVALPPSADLDTGLVEDEATVTVPSGSQVELPPLEYPSGTTLELRQGARARLPQGLESLLPDPGAEVVRLPPGTVVSRAPTTETTEEGLERLLDPSQPPTPDPKPDPKTPEISITQAPDEIEKGEPFTVSGRVTLDGKALVNHPVTLFANASKPAPGFEIQTERPRTDGDGAYEARAVVPEHRPTRAYHIVARADPMPEASPPTAAAWTDPVVHVTGEAELELDLPQRVGVDVPLTLQARLVDQHGAPVPNQTIAFDVDGREDSITADTGQDGSAIAVLTPGLQHAGNYTINARFPGTEHVTGDEAQAQVQAVEARIETAPTLQASRGEAATIEGRVVTDDASVHPLRLTARLGEDTANFTRTRPDGRFSLDLPVPENHPPGNHTVQLEAPAVDATRRVVLTVRAQLALAPPDLGPQPVGGEIPLPVQVVTANGTPTPGIPVEARLASGLADRAVTQDRGKARLAVPAPEPGTTTVQLATRADPAYHDAQRTIRFPTGPLDVTADLRVRPGADANGTVQLGVDDAPLEDVAVRLDTFTAGQKVRTDADGQARLQLEAPLGIEPGPVSANLTLPGYDLQAPVGIQVLDEPELAVTVIDGGQDGEPVRLSVQATGHDGPLSGIPVVAKAQGAFEARDQAITPSNGTVHLVLERPEDAEGPVTISVRAQSTDTTTSKVQIASTEVTPSPTPRAWFAGGLAVLGLAGVAVLRKRDREPTPPPFDPEGPQLSLAIAGQPLDLGDVWHPGEPVELGIRLRDADGQPIPDARVHLAGPKTDRDVPLDDEGRARVRLPAHDRGEARYRARYDGHDPPVETSLDLRIVHYREEIDREYRDLHEAAYRAGLVGPDATPRELARSLGEPGDELARIFERSDYSPRPVEREHYERFMRAKEAVDPRG